MRVINVRTQELETRKLEDFTSGERQYAILSHTWGTEEITISEMQSQPENNKADWRNKAGWRKILRSCEQAQKDECDYVWCDTCCIDKSSSAELSESINSMFRWYQEAKVCYAYLEEVEEVDELPRARWFTRGWTLQELIAPKSLVFYVDHEYNTAWREIGTRKKLASKIQGITGIDESFLRGAGSRRELREASFAKRVAWAANRNTERSEDIAYCLMGLLDVNMPLLYGEGGVKAFRRLQEEFLKVNVDQSFLAWLLCPKGGGPSTSNGNFLAGHPENFQECNRITVVNNDVAAFSLTNKGLQISLPLVVNSSDDAKRSPEYFALLACHPDGQPDYRIRISLRAVDRAAKTFVFLPGVNLGAVSTADMDVTRLTDCCILRSLQTSRILSCNDLPVSMVSWKPKIFYLDTSTWTWLCVSKPNDPDIRPIRVPYQQEKASYAIVFHPRSSYSDTTSSDCENTPCLKVLIRVDVGFEVRYEVNVRIQLFHVVRNEISEVFEAVPSVSSTEIPSNLHSRTISIPNQLPTQLSETIHASASWKRNSSQDELSVKIDLASVDRPRVHELGTLSIDAFKLLLTNDPLVHAVYAIIAMLTLPTLGPSYRTPRTMITASVPIVYIYCRYWMEKLLRRQDMEKYFRGPVVLLVFLIGYSMFITYDDVASSRFMPSLDWLTAIFFALIVLSGSIWHIGFEYTNKEELSVEESDPSTGLESLLLDDTI